MGMTRVVRTYAHANYQINNSHAILLELFMVILSIILI